MNSRIESAAGLRAAVESGRILTARCVWRKTSNVDWDLREKGHSTPWLPVRVKKTYFDNVSGFLNLEYFMFTDDADDLVLAFIGDSTYVLESPEFKYLFKEGDLADGVSTPDGT
jgi:hypothetical protein